MNTDMSAEIDSVEAVLEKYIPAGDDLNEIKRVLYGKPAKELDLSESTVTRAENDGYQVAGWKIEADQEETRNPREVQIGLIQNKIVLPTDAPIHDQISALQKRIGSIIENAGKSGVNIVCLQEAWTMPFAFCTREKHPWTQFAEPAETGASTMFLSELAARYRMVIISPILERDEDHGDTLWNTAVVIDHTGRVIGKTRKNHIPRVGDFNESTYYLEESVNTKFK